MFIEKDQMKGGADTNENGNRRMKNERLKTKKNTVAVFAKQFQLNFKLAEKREEGVARTQGAEETSGRRQ